MRTETPRPSASTGASNTDALLHGPILPLLLRFSLPNMVAMLAIALAAMAETAYVGQLGAGALAGMALVFPFVMLQNMLSAGAMGGGVSSAVSRALGAGDAAGANALAVHALWIGVAAGTAFMLLMECFGHAFMGLLGGRDEALAQAVAQLPRLQLRGIMTIPEPAENEATARAVHRQAKDLFDGLKAAGLNVALHVEPWTGRTPAAVASALRTLTGVGIRDVYVYDSTDLPDADWAAGLRTLQGVRVFAISIVISIVLALIIKATRGFRVTADQEVSGIDLAIHAESAYELGESGGGGVFAGVGHSARASLNSGIPTTTYKED